MSLAENNQLITTANQIEVPTNVMMDTIPGTGQADAFIFRAGFVGDDAIVSFGKNDVLINHQPLFDGNGDGQIAIGPNGTVDIDRTSRKATGEDQIAIIGLDGPEPALRFLGSKNGESVYADSSVRLAGFTEGTVGNDMLDGSSGARTFFYDTALGLNLGGDRITGFGLDDRIVTTTQIVDRNNDGTISFAKNGVLDLQGASGLADRGPGAAGQIELNGGSSTSIVLLGSSHVGQVTYYYYGLPGATHLEA